MAIDVNCVFEGRVTLGEGVRIGPNCVLRDVSVGAATEVLAFSHLERADVGARCRVGPFARLRPGASLADEVHVGNFVEVKASRIGAGSKANHLTYIGDADIGARVNVGAGTITCNYDGADKHCTVIEDDCFIGSDATLVAPVRIARGSYIGAGSTINKDTPAGPAHGGARAAGSFPGGSRLRRRTGDMCGIVGAAARRNIVPVLIEGLRRLEYRGYDSCGVAVLRNGGIDLVRTRLPRQRPRREGK